MAVVPVLFPSGYAWLGMHTYRQRGREEDGKEGRLRAALWSEFATHRLDSLSAPVLGQQPSCYFRSKRKDPSAKYETRKPVIENIERAF